MLRLLFITAGLFISCQPEKHYGIIEDSKVVELYLDEHGLENIPDDISRFRQAEILRVRYDRGNKWVILPPLSILLDSTANENPLTPGICELTELRELDLSGQLLTSLPPCFTQLRSLQKLNIAANRLNLNKEWVKLKQLPDLKVLYIDGNMFNKKNIPNWEHDRPDIEIVYDHDQPSTKDELNARTGLESFINDYYQSMSDRDWTKYREFFWANATLTTVWQATGDSVPGVHVNTIDEFIDGTEEGPDSQPIFEEKPTHIEIDMRGDLAAAWVNYKAKFGSEEELMEWTGTDLFTLMRHDGKWRIVSLAYSSD